MANTKISALTANTNPTGNEELVYAYNNANGKMTLDTMKTFASADSQATLVSGVNIKTINNTSILGSGNIDVSGGGGGGFTPTELGGDANIWELSEGAYITEHDLYYTTGNAINRGTGTGLQYKQMIFVVQNAGGTRGFIAFNGYDRTGIGVHNGKAFFGYSNSSSEGDCKTLGAWDEAISGITLNYTGGMDEISGNYFTHVISSFVDDTSSLRVGSSLYSGMTYTIYVASYSSGATATVTLGTGVTNPLGIALPTNSNKAFVIKMLATSASTAIVTSCTIAN